MCKNYDALCDSILAKIGCPETEIKKFVCTDFNNYWTYIGICSCGDFDVADDRIAELITDG